jgi:hypothetical protein
MSPHCHAPGLHTLDGGQRQAGGFGKLALIHPQQGAGGTDLGGSNHVLSMLIEYKNIRTHLIYIIINAYYSLSESDTIPPHITSGRYLGSTAHTPGNAQEWPLTIFGVRMEVLFLSMLQVLILLCL